MNKLASLLRGMFHLKLFNRSGRAEQKIAGTADVLRGAPLRPRLKTYSAQSGYVYQYVYRGKRTGPNGVEFVFSVTARAAEWLRITVHLRHEVIANYERNGALKLSPQHEYAIAKFALFDHFDSSGQIGQDVHVWPESEAVNQYLFQLGVGEGQ